MSHIYDLTSRKSADPRLSGGKGANLHKMIRQDFAVPKGFVIATTAFAAFVRANHLASLIKTELAKIVADDQATYNKAAKAIQKAIKAGAVPEKILAQIERELILYKRSDFAVRSSAVVEDGRNQSWAGQFDSYLNVSRDEIAETVKLCWASFFNARALHYNIKAYRGGWASKFAVVVQTMLASDVSGVAFSADPHDAGKILIEATKGSGDNLVSGKVQPVSLSVSKGQKAVVRAESLLSAPQANRLTEQLLRLEKLFGAPVDVEWAFEKGRLYLLQVRPVTARRKVTVPRKAVGAWPELSDYKLTFKVTGLSLFFIDMLRQGYGYMQIVCTSNQGKFCQYIPQERMDYAARTGLRWLKDKNGFKNYKHDFTVYYKQAKKDLQDILKQKKLTKPAAMRFYKIIGGMFKFYSRMDYPFTNAIDLQNDKDAVLISNLELLSGFKDHARAWINEMMLDEQSLFSQFVARLSQDFLMLRSEMQCYTLDDMTALFDGVRVSKAEIKNRKMAYALWVTPKQTYYLSGAKAQAFIQANAAESEGDAELIGQIAHGHGKTISGAVRTIPVAYDDMKEMNRAMAAMKKGEILVAEFTAPELMMACKKAKAIITDLGGMLSHAAIVSRELNIPCLVGTSHATKRFKTGDQVTIDFKSGRVTKQTT